MGTAALAPGRSDLIVLPSGHPARNDTTPDREGIALKTFRGLPATRWAAGLAILTLVAAAARLHFGVDFTDEAYYATLPYRFVLGDTPYVSEFSVGQNVGLLTFPLVSAWVRITDGEGLVLFLRYVYLAMRVVVALLAIHALSTRAPRSLAIVAALIPVAFVLYRIPAPSYNTVASSAVTAAFLCALLFFDTGKSRYAAGLAASVAVAVFAHPVVAPVALALTALVVWRAPRGEARRGASMAIGGVAAIVLLLGVVGMGLVGADNLRTLVREAGANTAPSVSLGRIAGFPTRLLELSRGGWLLAALWIALWFVGRAGPVIIAAIFAAYTGLALLADQQAGLLWLALASLPLSWNLRRTDGEAPLRDIATLSLAGGFLVGAFSTNGVSNAVVGSEVAAMIAFVSAFLLVADAEGGGPVIGRRAPAAVIALAAVTVLGFSVAQWRAVYRDDAITRLTNTVERGPFRGMRTTPTKAAFLGRVQAALEANRAGMQSLVSLVRFPAAHLMIPVRPALRLTFIPTAQSGFALKWRETLVADVARAPRPMLVLQVFSMPTTVADVERWDDADADPLWRAIAALRPTPLAQTPEFALHAVADTRP